jgi:glucose/arabinose dehydrogenase
VRAAGAALVLLAACALTGCTDDPDQPSDETLTATPAPTSTSPTSSAPPGSAQPTRPPRVVGTVATGLRVPWGIGFLPDGDAIVTERDTKRVLRIHGPRHRVEEIGTFEEPVPAGSAGESGLLGVAVSPDFASDHLLYFYVTTASDNRIVTRTYEGGRLGAERVLLDGIPRGFIHDGGRLLFGPDGDLYASTGETGEGSLAQDRGSLAGKILRITPDGDPASGNPFPGSPVWSYGHRNVQGLAFDDRDRLWASEFGQDTFDELNLIEPGDNYGWPTVEGRGNREGLVDPQVVWDPAVASPSGLAYLDGHLWLASLRGQRLWRIDVTGPTATDPTDFFVGRYGRMRTVAVAPDGRLWVSTSNHDGRGAPSPADDRILVVDPG